MPSNRSRKAPILACRYTCASSAASDLKFAKFTSQRSLLIGIPYILSEGVPSACAVTSWIPDHVGKLSGINLVIIIAVSVGAVSALAIGTIAIKCCCHNCTRRDTTTTTITKDGNSSMRDTDNSHTNDYSQRNNNSQRDSISIIAWRAYFPALQTLRHSFGRHPDPDTDTTGPRGLRALHTPQQEDTQPSAPPAVQLQPLSNGAKANPGNFPAIMHHQP